MKLIGSLTEKVIREELINANMALSDSSEVKKIVSFLTQLYFRINSAYTLHWILEPDIEILEILVNGNFIIVLEVERIDYSFRIVKKISINKYRVGLKQKDQLKLLIALDLAMSQS